MNDFYEHKDGYDQVRWEATGDALTGANIHKLRALLEPIENALKNGHVQSSRGMALEFYFDLRDHVFGLSWDVPNSDNE